MDIEKEVQEHVAIRDKLIDAISFEGIREICKTLNVDGNNEKGDWITPLGNIMGAMMYILDMHAAIDNETRIKTFSSIAATLVTHVMENHIEESSEGQTIN